MAPEEDIPILAMVQLYSWKLNWQHWSSPRSQTWGQVKSLVPYGQIIVQQYKRWVTAENCFLTVCALLIVSSVQGSGISYCVYIPCTPRLKPVFWWDTDVLVYSTVSILSPPWNDLTYLNKFDGTSYNTTYKDDRKPISFGNCPCLSVRLHYYNVVLK